jgi:hypothetical protein
MRQVFWNCHFSFSTYDEPYFFLSPCLFFFYLSLSKLSFSPFLLGVFRYSYLCILALCSFFRLFIYILCLIANVCLSFFIFVVNCIFIHHTFPGKETLKYSLISKLIWMCTNSMKFASTFLMFNLNRNWRLFLFPYFNEMMLLLLL